MIDAPKVDAYFELVAELAGLVDAGRGDSDDALDARERLEGLYTELVPHGRYPKRSRLWRCCGTCPTPRWPSSPAGRWPTCAPYPQCPTGFTSLAVTVPRSMYRSSLIRASGGC